MTGVQTCALPIYVLLLDAIEGAVRREVGAGWEWDMRQSLSDATPIAAATAALRALEMVPEVAPFKLWSY